MRVCPITKKRTVVGGKYSNRTRATKFNPTGKHKKGINMIKQKLFVEELGKSVTVKMTAAGFRTVKKNGVYKTLKKHNLI